MNDRPTVVLLHGLGRTHRCFRDLRLALEQAGYPTWALDYPSMRITAAQASRLLEDRVAAELPGRPLYGVGHSLGSILIRLTASTLPWRRAVMLAPPNNGSGLVKALDRTPGLWLLAGKPRGELGRNPDWPSPPSPFAVIAGTQPGLADRGHRWLGKRLGVFDNATPNDGVITVAETRHPEMSAFASVRAGHYHLMNHPRVRELTVRFLRTGSF